MISNLKPYPAYQESGLAWLGEVPQHWATERAKWLFMKMDRPVREEDDVVTCFRDGMVTLRKNRRLRGFTEATAFSGYQGIRRGDLVIHGMDAFAGSIGVSDSDGKGTPVYNVCQPRPGINAHYYAHLVRQMSQSQWILALAKGIRERSTDFRFEMFGGQKVPLPPPDEQAAIVRFLYWANGRLERAIRAKRKVIALLGEQKQAIIHRAVTRGLDPDVPLKPSGIPWLGDIPQHWEVRRLKSLSPIKRGASPRPIADMRFFDDSGEYAWVRIKDVTASKSYLEKTTERLSELGKAKSVPLEPGTIFLSIAGSVGKPVITRIKCCIHDGFVYFPQFRAKAEFLRYVLSSGRVYDGLGKLGTQLNLNTETVGSIRIPWPKPIEQASIVEVLDREASAFDIATSRIEREIELLREYRTRLVADVVTGKLDVREAAARLPDVAAPDLVEDDAEIADELDSEAEESAA